MRRNGRSNRIGLLLLTNALIAAALAGWECDNPDPFSGSTAVGSGH